MWLWLPFVLYEWAKTTSIVQWKIQCNSMLVIESLISKFVTSVSDLFLCVCLCFTNKRTRIFGGSLKHWWNGAFWFMRQHNSEDFSQVLGLNFCFWLQWSHWRYRLSKRREWWKEEGGKEGENSFRLSERLFERFDLTFWGKYIYIWRGLRRPQEKYVSVIFISKSEVKVIPISSSVYYTKSYTK
jgi:hypothetical protein